ncbi:MAG: hypothetical protein PHT44_03885 [Candidatus Portnoybacteria bacterium]|nr:hypothetical protein [Candidatus Portnoybacteria bacterium]MDD4983034.1 hypothetical protein [Candidatus Portnoybacteria bacterium]
MENERKEGGTLKTIEIVLMAAAITLLWKLFEAVMSYKDKTFSLGQLEEYSRTPVKFHGQYRWQHLPMSFLNNWAASWGDMYIFPVVNALVVSSLWPVLDRQWNGVSFFVMFTPFFLVAGIAVSILFHRAWWGHDENLGHIFIGWNIGHTPETRVPVEHNGFYDDMTKAGWVHFWFMSAQVAVMLAYIVAPMPKEVVFWVSGLLAAFFIIQNAQAVMIQRGSWKKHFFIAMAENVIVWNIAIAKIL